MTKFAMVGIFLFIPLTLVLCSTSIKVGHLRAGEVSSRVLGNDEMLQNTIPHNQGVSSYGKLEKQADQGKRLIPKNNFIDFVFRSASLFSSAKIE